VTVRITPPGTRGTGFVANMPRWAVGPYTLMNRLMFRVAGARMRIQGRPLLQLETLGAKTGARRLTNLGAFDDPERPGQAWLIVASAAGAARHPAWLFNLVRHPDDAWITLDGKRMAVRAESLAGDERRRAWDRIVALAPGYGKYATVTDREIPIVRLTPKT
jgi:deazaflavin-dependent oxidoreductase (nitroreductase family)